MQIQRVQTNTTFTSKHYLDKNNLQKAQQLLTRMNSETVYKESNGLFQSTSLNLIKIGDRVSFWDRRCLSKPNNIMKGCAMLKDDKTVLNFDVVTGEIRSYDKPWYKCWKNVMVNFSKTLNFILNNYNNEKVVEKNFIEIKGLTEAGYNRLNSISERHK